jgi:Putative polyhydroxyalkanoic acid system protein (PHA_gran_rgn)
MRAGAYIRVFSQEAPMPNTITVTVPHTLGVETAKKRLAERLEELRRDYVDKVAHSEVSWAGDVATIRVAAIGQQASALITVLADQVRIDIELPWALAVIAGKVRDVVSRNANDVLRIGKS